MRSSRRASGGQRSRRTNRQRTETHWDKAERSEASGAPPEAAENCGAAREADKANGARPGATEAWITAEGCGGIWRPSEARVTIPRLVKVWLTWRVKGSSGSRPEPPRAWDSWGWPAVATGWGYGRPTLAEPDREPEERGLEHWKPEGQLAEMRSQTKASVINMEGKVIDRLSSRAYQSLRLLGVTSSRYRMGLRASNNSRAGQGAWGSGTWTNEAWGAASWDRNSVILNSTSDRGAGCGEGAEESKP